MRDAFPKPPHGYRITLACGCTVTARDKPANRRMLLMCRNNLGHGYNLPWTAFTDIARNHTITNPETTP